MGNRVTRKSVEAVIAPTSQKARITRDVVEAVIYPDNEKARLTRVVVEVVIFSPQTIDPAPFGPRLIQSSA
ncbi:MAG TPA: hypothetical protein VFK94_06430 [Patescibacteria group bacterium]|nr:hypothetical protein [Patescibacteria group bacterium]